METNLGGMDPASAKEYIYGFISTLKLTEKKIQEIDAELLKWNSRAELARAKGHPDLALEAEKEIERLKTKKQELDSETAELKLQIEQMRRQLPALAACARSIDPDLLEQELLMAAGYLPGEEEKAKSNRTFSKMEKDAAADDALLQLKAKMGK